MMRIGFLTVVISFAFLRPCLGDPPCCEAKKLTFQLHWLEREVPITEPQLVLRPENRTTAEHVLEPEFKPEQRVRTQLVLKPREIVKEVTICTLKPKVTKDPHTGCSTVVFEPIKETRQVKEMTYDLVPEEKVETYQTGCLKPVAKSVTRQTLTLDWKTEPKNKVERFGVLVPLEVSERKPACTPQ